MGPTGSAGIEKRMPTRPSPRMQPPRTTLDRLALTMRTIPATTSARPTIAIGSNSVPQSPDQVMGTAKEVVNVWQPQSGPS